MINVFRGAGACSGSFEGLCCIVLKYVINFPYIFDLLIFFLLLSTNVTIHGNSVYPCVCNESKRVIIFR